MPSKEKKKGGGKQTHKIQLKIKNIHFNIDKTINSWHINSSEKVTMFHSINITFEDIKMWKIIFI